jgi:hypothetical protein
MYCPQAKDFFFTYFNLAQSISTVKQILLYFIVITIQQKKKKKKMKT